MSYKLIIKDLTSQETETYFLEVDSFPDEVSLLEDLIHLEVVKDVEGLEQTSWYDNLISGCIILDKKHLNKTLQVIEVSEIPEDLLDENTIYLYKVVSSCSLGSNTLYNIDYVSSQNKDLKFHSDLSENVIESSDIIKVISKINSVEYLDLLLFLTEEVPSDVESYEINGYGEPDAPEET